MQIQNLIDEALQKEQELRKDRVSSNKWKPSLFGSCFRRHYWSKIGEPESDPTDARGLRVFQAGKLFHDFAQQFFPIEQKEVLIETPEVKGYADIVTADEVIDLKSVHSDSFWYLKRNILCTLPDGKEVRVEEGAISGNKVRYNKKEYEYTSKKTLSILDEKINNWLQVCWYAVQLNKPKCRLVFISKDDLCIEEYVIATEKIKNLLDEELSALYNITKLPEAKPRLYKGDECKWCGYATKCKQQQEGNVCSK